MDSKTCAMEIDPQMHEEEEDPFLQFISYAKSVVSPDANEAGGESVGPGWSWIASRILKTCIAYSSGVTSAILLSDLSQVLTALHSLSFLRSSFLFKIA